MSGPREVSCYFIYKAFRAPVSSVVAHVVYIAKCSCFVCWWTASLVNIDIVNKVLFIVSNILRDFA